MQIIELDPATWLRGEGAPPSFLIRPADEKMCCLGFALFANGCGRELLLGVKAPAGVMVPAVRNLGLVDEGYHTPLSEVLMNENDLEVITDQERIKRLNSHCVTYSAPFRFALKCAS